ncbi:hypothetical protein ABES02_05455 [Neobacillus pocheonensis]|uniref:hypothetical protein n=1 Tax=Neobacillus pocheonensis TaxID=363869 RepID=UPI003D29DE62
MRKKFLKLTSIIAVVLILGSALIVWQNHSVFAKKQETNSKLSAEARMAKYTVKPKQNADPNVRRSRLNQINVVNEAAAVLNVLPITIMEDMTKGKTLEQIAKEKGYMKAKFLKKLTDVDTKNIDAAATSGTISKEQAAVLKEGQKDRLNHNLMLEAVDVNDHKAMDMNH